MSVVQLRGGVPHVFRDTITTTGREHRIPFNTTFLKIRNEDTTNFCKLYFREADFDADANFVKVPAAAASAPYGEWEGPVELYPEENHRIWLKADTASTAIELVAFQRRA